MSSSQTAFARFFLYVFVFSLVLTGPFYLFRIPTTYTDLDITILARFLAAHLLWENGLYTRVPNILSGIESWSSGIFSPKLDAIYMMFTSDKLSIGLYIFFRTFFFVGLLAFIFIKLYAARSIVAVFCAGAAAAGLNVFNWLYEPSDYLAGGTLSSAYVSFPILLLPLLLQRQGSNILLISIISFIIGLAYGFLNLYYIVPFAIYAAGLWVIVEYRSWRGIFVASMLALGGMIAIIPDLLSFLDLTAANSTRSGPMGFTPSWIDTIKILLARDTFVSGTATILTIGALFSVYRDKDRTPLVVFLLLLYAATMFLDPAIKAASQTLHGVAPGYIISTSYYTYVFSPIILSAIWCIGYSSAFPVIIYLVSIGIILLSIRNIGFPSGPHFIYALAFHALIIIAALMAWVFRKQIQPTYALAISVAVLIGVVTINGTEEDILRKAGPGLSTYKQTAQLISGQTKSGERAAVIMETEADLSQTGWVLSRIVPNHFAVYGLNMADGYVPAPPMEYAVFMSNAGRSASEAATDASDFTRQIYLQVPVADHLTASGEGCLSQTSEIDVDAHMQLPLLQNAAVRYVISMYELKSKYLKMVHEGNGVFCQSDREGGRPYIYQFTSSVPRFSFARTTSEADGALATVEAMREDVDFASSDRVVLSPEAIDELGTMPVGLGDLEGKLEVTGERADTITLSVTTPIPTLLLVRDSYSQRVRAEIEGKPLKVARANLAFYVVQVPQGKNTVQITYE